MGEVFEVEVKLGREMGLGRYEEFFQDEEVFHHVSVFGEEQIGKK